MKLRDYQDALEENRGAIKAWMKKKRSEVPIPIYGSVDVRDAGWKVGVVDANHFPAGFNNVPQDSVKELAHLFSEHLQRSHPGCQWVHLLPENHTRNQAYVENIATIKAIIEQAGFRCTVGSVALNDFSSLHGLSGPLMLDRVEMNEDNLSVGGATPDLILLNNDLTEGSIPGLEGPNITPPPHMGWYRRRKSEH